jgi:iron(III) transport system ATP-binding protein
MASIQLSNVEKQFGRSVKAVDELTLTIDDGSFVCLLGPSGCGKTTTLRMIAGLERPTAGSISVGERKVDSISDGIFVPPEKRSMGLVFQNYALWPHMTVERNVGFGLQVNGTPRAEQRERIEELAALLRIEGLEKRYPHELSGGQQQRVALARMLATNPVTLLLDEPLSNLDAKLRLEMRSELKRLHRELKTTIVFVTHDQHEAMTMATEIAVMHEGKLQQFGPPTQIYSEPANEFIADFIGSPPMGFIDIETPLGRDVARQLGDRGAAEFVPSSRRFGVRPESIQVIQARLDTSSGWSGSARVDAILPTGANWLVSLLFDGGTELFALAYESPDFDEGQRINVAMSASSIAGFDESGICITSSQQSVPT